MLCDMKMNEKNLLQNLDRLKIYSDPGILVHSGPSCSKLTTSLVNISLKFQMLISEISQYFLLKKCEKLLHSKSFSHFFNKNIGGFGYKVVKHIAS